jgi:uncharacterized protein (TIGR03086 family)
VTEKANENLAGAVRVTQQVLAKVHAGQLHERTPCAAWDVAELINHMVGVPTFFASVVTGEPPRDEAPNYSSGDFLVAFEAASATCVEAYSDDAVLEQIYDFPPIGKTPGSVCLSIATSETFVHGWDLARATGQDTDLDPALAAKLLEIAKATLPAEYRNESGSPFGPEKQAPAGAGAADQLAAFMGRDV